jgi:hypothetical protein
MCEGKRKTYRFFFFQMILVHRIPISILRCFVEGIKSIKKKGKLFKSQDVVCRLDGTENDRLPHYKISYAIQQTNVKLLLCIPTIKDVKLRVSHGRINGKYIPWWMVSLTGSS